MLPAEPTSDVGFGEVQGGHVSQRLKLSNAVVAERYNRDRERERGKGKKSCWACSVGCRTRKLCDSWTNHQCHVLYGIREIGLQRDIVF
jgi:hypothetical protein